MIYTSLRYDFNMFSSNFVLQAFPDVKSCWTVFRNNVTQLMKKYVPNRISRSRKTNAWMNTETRRMVRGKSRAFTKSQFTKSPGDLERYKYLKSKCQRFIRQAYNTYIQNIVCHDARKTPMHNFPFLFLTSIFIGPSTLMGPGAAHRQHLLIRVS